VLLSEAVAIERLRLLGADPEAQVAPLRACLGRVLDRVMALAPPTDAQLTGLCLGLLLSVLLARLPAAEALLMTTADVAMRSGDPASRLAADRAVDAMLDQAEARLAQHTGLALDDLAGLAGLIEALEQPGPAGRPTRKPRALALRRALDGHCRQRFEVNLAERLLHHLPALGAASPDAQVDELEQAALELRRWEAVGRRFGGAAHYERALAEGGQALLKLAQPDANRVDLARLMEILQGPEAGLAVLDAGVR